MWENSSIWQWIKDGISAYVNGWFDYQKSALADTLAAATSLFPADTRGSVAPYLELMQWINDWLPVSELFVNIVSWYAFLGAFWLVRTIIRLISFGVLGKS